MAKDKVLRDKIKAATKSPERRLVRANPKDALLGWHPPIKRDGADFFQLSLVPPRPDKKGSVDPSGWFVRASDDDDTSYVRYGLSEREARSIYDSIVDEMSIEQMKEMGFHSD